MASDTLPISKVREKTILKPGFHLMDWMRLSSSQDVSGRNGKPLRRIPMSEIEKHNTEDDCWTVFNKKVISRTYIFLFLLLLSLSLFIIFLTILGV